MKPGRNDPCPCGSGKKYKKCCLAKLERPAPPELDLEEEDEEPDVRHDALAALMDFAWAPQFRRAFEAAGGAFWGGDDEGPEDEELAEDEHVKFSFYFLFDHTLEDGRSLAELFLQREGVSIRNAELRMIRRWIGARLRPYEVEEVVRDEGLRLRDLWSGETLFVTERIATRQLARWDLLGARVAPEDDGTRCLEGVPYVLPARAKERLLDALRDEERRLRWTEPGLGEDRFFRRCAPLFHRFWLAEAVSSPLPALVTAEGDPMVFGKVVFDVRDRAAAVAALDRHAELEPDGDGGYSWVEEAERGFTRSLGRIELGEDRLVLEVTSRERAERGRQLLEQAAGTSLRHRATRYESVGKALERHAAKPRKPPAAGIPAEIAAQVVLEYKERHYETWPDEPLPALDGRTPRQAVRTKKLRPRLVDLLKEMENMEARATRPDNPAYDFGRIWTELGLTRPK